MCFSVITIQCTVKLVSIHCDTVHFLIQIKSNLLKYIPNVYLKNFNTLMQKFTKSSNAKKPQ